MKEKRFEYDSRTLSLIRYMLSVGVAHQIQCILGSVTGVEGSFPEQRTHSRAVPVREATKVHSLH